MCAPLFLAYGITCWCCCPGVRACVFVVWLPFWGVDDGERAVAAVDAAGGEGDGAVARVAAPRVVYVFGEGDGLGVAGREDGDGARGEIS